MEIKLTILILSHNRPKLFERCLKSVLKNKPDWVKIIVNNDTRDIIEIKHKDVIYYYNKYKTLGEIYNFLLDNASSEYAYFLEDDDYVVDNFYDKIELGNTIYKYIPNDGIGEILKKNYDFEHMFQLFQIIFKVDEFRFPENNNIHNDWLLYKHLENNIAFSDKIIFIQTTDGKDNISFKSTNDN